MARGGRSARRRGHSFPVVYTAIGGDQAYSFIRLSLGRRSVILIPVAHRTIAFTNIVNGRTWVVGREIKSHVHNENAF